MIRKFLKSIILRFGIIFIKKSSRAYIPEDSVYHIVARLCDQTDPVIIDGGSHKGETVLQLSALLPQAEFHCFEPDPELVDELAIMFREKATVHVVAAALGQALSKAMFNINIARPTNSLLPASDTLKTGLKTLCQIERQVEVNVTTIDEYCWSQGLDKVDVVKLDLQGYDYLALQGAKKTLKSVKIVLVEVLFTEIYTGCGLFPDILCLMKEFGFDLYTLCGLQYGDESQLLWADAIFVKNG